MRPYVPIYHVIRNHAEEGWDINDGCWTGRVDSLLTRAI